MHDQPSPLDQLTAGELIDRLVRDPAAIEQLLAQYRPLCTPEQWRELRRRCGLGDLIEGQVVDRCLWCNRPLVRQAGHLVHQDTLATRCAPPALTGATEAPTTVDSDRVDELMDAVRHPTGGDTMTLADIAARCRSDALSLREAATYATAIDFGKIARQATDRADTADALATLLDRLARLPAANTHPPYVDAAQRLARLAGVDL